MAPSRRKGASKAAAAAAARRQWKVGDLVLAKVKGFPAWPATVSEPEKWGYSADWKKVLVYFFGTQQIAFCNPADVEPFTEEKKQSLLTKRHGKGSDFVRAVQEIIDSYEKLKNQNQADDFNSEEVVDMSGRNMASSSADLESKEKIEAPEATFDSQFNPSHSNADGSGPSLPVDDTSASALVDDVDKKEEPGDTTIVTETSLHTVYSSRKRTKDLPLQNGDSKEPLVRRSRSSSRLESRRLRDSVVQSSDTGKSSGTVSATVVCDGFLTRNKSKRKSAEASEFDDADLSGLASSGSIEDNGSDVVTVESDSISLNEGSTIDSACKMDHSEAIVGCFSGDLQTKAVVLKKKRKPNRKRPTNDSLEPIPTVDKEVDVPNTSESSQNDFEKTSVSGGCPKKDGDEHLPLVKRARVRMGEPSSLKEPNSNTNTEDNAQKEHMVHTSGETNKSSSCDDHIDRISLMMNAALDASPSQGCTQFYGNKSNHWKTKKDQSFGCSVDGEAALPPSKRLHRALEAMSANAAEEGQSRNDKSSDMNTLAYGCLVASMSRSHIAVEGQMATVENVDSIGSDAQGAEASGFPSSLSPVAGKNAESTPEADFNDQGAESSNSQNNESGKEFFLDAGHCADEKSPCGGSDGGEIIPTALLSQSPRHLLSSPDRKESDVRSAQVSEYDLLRTEDKGNTETIELINFRSEKTDKEFDMCEGTAMSMDPVSAPHEDLIEASLAFQSNTDGACFEKSRSSELPLDDSREENDMSEVVTEVVNKQMQKEPSSVCFPNGHVGDGVGIHSSPSVTDGGNSLAQASPHNASSGHVSTSDNSSFIQNNGSCSPDVHLHHKITSNTLLDEEGKSESMVSQRPKSVGKYAELNAALTSFEAMLGSLTRTKESIGRATRVAIECAKLGVSSKVVDILAHCLETESSLHRRVDLFFLVDSILKGDVGGLYPSAIQAMLPRLLAAAAPPGNSAHENRRQCLKVLRLWLERKILSESVIRRHMRELDSLACSAAGAYSRRSLRTQRSFDDPLREMEGMLVDEYGSNSSFQLPGFCMPSMVKDEDGGSDSDGGSLEAVAPGHSPENREDHETTLAMEKHRHILEDVDGELEMEDVAPSCETELNSSSGAIGVGSAQMSQNQFEQHFSVPFAPPLPQDVPPSSPPLPSSPPPLPLAPLPPPIPPPGAVSDPYTNGIDSKHYADSHFYADSHNMHETVAQSNAQQSNTPRINRTMSEAVHYHAPDCRDLQRNMRESYPDPYFHNKGYPLWPPHPPPTNQFSYGRGEPHFKPRREAGPPPPYSNRHHFEQYWDRENFYDNHERMEHGPHEPHDSWRFPPHSFSGPRYPGKGKFYEPDPFVGPPCEETRYSNQGWRFPSRSMNHRNFMPFRPPLDGRIPISNRGPGYWRPR